MKKENTHDCIHCGCHNPITQKMIENLTPHAEIINPKREHKIPSLVYVSKSENSTIIPILNRTTQKVEAIAFHKGKVFCSGTEKFVLNTLKNQNFSFKIIELKEKQTILPGFVEPHMHIIPSAFLGTWKNLSRIQNQRLIPKYDFEYLKETIQEEIKNIEKIDSDEKQLWFLGKEVDPSLMPFQVIQTPGSLTKLESFNHHRLDEIDSEIPIALIAASMHTIYLNTLGLKNVYNANSVNEDFKTNYPNYEVFEEKSNGLLQEPEQMKWLIPAIPESQVLFAAENVSKYVSKTFEEAARKGVTFLYDAALQDISVLFLSDYLEKNEIPVRFGGAKVCFTLEDIEKMGEFEPITNYYDGYIANIKLISDGANQGLTGFQSETFCCEPENNFGKFNFDVPTFHQIVKSCLDQNWSMMIHANGNKALKQTIDAYEFALVDKNPEDFRNRIEHCSLLNQNQLQRMHALNLSPSFLIGHVGYWGFVFRNAIFKEKAETLDLCRSALNYFLKISLHSDFGVTPIGGLRLMEQAITRIMEASPNSPQISESNVLNPKERISPECALRAVTIDAAWQCHADHWVGSLENGKFADYVILEQNPLEITNPYQNMRDIKVLETWKGGVRVYCYNEIN
ncbi:amidohydrolase [Aureivirga sp. CE67]|uniref:amidohydrolase n=1 Tax=Aureivirga sp. CE67 TaxID=1788983 RepID=UPI0018CB5D2F|nr:amidohydrolase family protein [Aureivirga sp. CE67]